MSTLVQIESAVAGLPQQDQWSLLTWLQGRLSAAPKAVPGASTSEALKVGAVQNEAKPKRQKPTATPEMIARRLAAFEVIRKLDPYRDIKDAVAWQREIREDVVQPGRE